MTRPRIVLVEDDAALRRFVEMVLEDLAVNIVACENVPQAIAALRAEPVDLLITDLMMPGETGIDLLNQLKAEPTLAGEAKIMVMSAGLTSSIRAQLAQHTVWQVIEKPVSVVLLEQSIVSALGDKLDHQAAKDAVPLELEAPTTSPPQSPSQLPIASLAHLELGVALVEPHVDTYFGGDMALYTAYRDACLAEIPNDIRQADISAQNADWTTLRRVAHDLSSVLAALGKHHLSTLAKTLELASQAGDAALAQANWSALRTPLQAIAQGAH